MANFPTNLDTIKKDWANDSPVKDTHPSEHNLVAESVEALEAKVGVDGSAVTTTHDYKLSGITVSAKALSDTANQSVAGVFTFAQNLIIPIAPTEDTHATSKKYVDDLDESNVKIDGDNQFTGENIFDEPVKVPNAVVDGDAVNKEDLDTAVEGINKESVGLFTQGEFIDTLTGLDLSFRNTATMIEATVTEPYGSQHRTTSSFDGINVFAGRLNTAAGDAYLEYGTYDDSTDVLTAVETQYEVSGNDPDNIFVKAISATQAVYIEQDGTVGRILLGTWGGASLSKGALATFTIPSGYSPCDVRKLSATEFLLLYEDNAVGFRVFRATLSGTTWTIDGSYGGVGYKDVAVSLTQNSTFFLDDDHVICELTTDHAVSIYDISGTPSLAVSYTDADLLAEEDLTTSSWTQLLWHSDTLFSVKMTNGSAGRMIFSWNGTDTITPERFYTTSRNFAYGQTINIGDTEVDFAYIDTSDSYRQTASDTGSFENAIIDTTASGHLQKIASSSATSSSCSDIIITGTTNNDGTYSPTTSLYTSPNKLTFASPQFTDVGIENCDIKLDLSDAGGKVWELKGSNYYLGNN